jgi:NADPH-dependent 2,4-dienoyl-CoA reductase/sulfur reductase-like enzyme
MTLHSPKVKRDRIVVVGGGLAGLRAAERLRETGFTGELVIVGAERRRPYHRPALSKQLLTGELRPKDLALRSYLPLDAIWRRGAYVHKLDPRRHVLELAGDEEIRYDGLVVATGVQARHLPGAPRHDPRVHVLRTMADAIALQRGIATGSGRVAVIGGGFTACEVASTARELGCEVTVLSRSKVLLGKVLGAELGAEMAELHRANGVRVELGVEVTQWLCQPWGVTMQLSTGKVVTAGTVVLAVGSTPAVQWLRGSGLTLEDGVLCRPTCHVVGANDIVAAGDVARWPNLRFEATPRRVEHWMNAVDMGRAAADSLLAGATEARPFTPLPRFWSEQHGMHLQAAGMPALGQQTKPLDQRRAGGDVTGYVRNGRLIGIVSRDSAREMLRWTEELKRELRRQETVTLPGFGAELAEAAALAEPVDERVLEPEPVVERRERPRPNPAPMAQPPRRDPVPVDRVAWTEPEPAWADDWDLTRELHLDLTQELPVITDRPISGPVTQELPPVVDDRPQHPSLPGLRPVPPPLDRRPRPLPRAPEPARQHVSVSRPLPSFPEMPRLRPEARSDGPLPEHPSLPNMEPVGRPLTEFERRRERQLLEWQFRLR